MDLLHHVLLHEPSGNIFVCREEVAINGERYAVIIGTSPEQSPIRYHESTLTDLGDAYDFVEKYFPDYYHADTIAWEDDLYCALNDECDDDKLARIKTQWGGTKAELQAAHDELYFANINRAIDNYRNMLTAKTQHYDKQ